MGMPRSIDRHFCVEISRFESYRRITSTARAIAVLPQRVRPWAPITASAVPAQLPRMRAICFSEPCSERHLTRRDVERCRVRCSICVPLGTWRKINGNLSSGRWTLVKVEKGLREDFCGIRSQKFEQTRERIKRDSGISFDRRYCTLYCVTLFIVWHRQGDSR